MPCLALPTQMKAEPSNRVTWKETRRPRHMTLELCTTGSLLLDDGPAVSKPVIVACPCLSPATGPTLFCEPPTSAAGAREAADIVAIRIVHLQSYDVDA
mmetsp:Transcript_109001/g.211016  ORF Transcript_109001/g.211016 Transcript_109001/m.211016 type:complete len:99 (-) Transcript_109001:4-300(-)